MLRLAFFSHKFLTLFLILQVFGLSGATISSAYAVPGGLLEVTFIDLGTAGDSTLIILPNGKTILIDGGYKKSFSNIKEVLDNNGVFAIDILIATHDDADHVNGLKKIIEEDIPIGKIWVNPLNNTEFPINKENPYDLKIVSAQTISSIDDDIDFEILSPPLDTLDDGARATISNTNSIVSKLTFGNISFLFGGDTTYLTEEWILENYLSTDIDIDIMNGFHHGSKHSNTIEFLEAVTPKIVVFSANDGNHHGHPDIEAKQNFETIGADIYQTGIDGNIVIKTNGAECSIIIGNDVDVCFDGVDMLPSAGGVPPPAPESGNDLETIRSSIETIDSAINTAESAINTAKTAMSLGQPVSESTISSLDSVSSALDLAKTAVSDTSPAIEHVSYDLKNDDSSTTNFELNIGNQEGIPEKDRDPLDMLVEEGIAQVAAILSLGIGALVAWLRTKGIPITQDQEKAFKEMVTTRFKKLARETWTEIKDNPQSLVKWRAELEQGKIPKDFANTLRKEGKSFAEDLLDNREFKGFAKELTKQGQGALDNYLKDIRNNLKDDYKKKMVDLIPKLISLTVDSTFETFEKKTNYDNLLDDFLKNYQDNFSEELSKYKTQKQKSLNESKKDGDFNYKCYLELLTLHTFENLKPLLLSTEALDTKKNLKLIIKSEINKRVDVPKTEYFSV